MSPLSCLAHACPPVFSLRFLCRPAGCSAVLWGPEESSASPSPEGWGLSPPGGQSSAAAELCPPWSQDLALPFLAVLGPASPAGAPPVRGPLLFTPRPRADLDAVLPVLSLATFALAQGVVRPSWDFLFQSSVFMTGFQLLQARAELQRWLPHLPFPPAPQGCLHPPPGRAAHSPPQPRSQPSCDCLSPCPSRSPPGGN